MPGARWTEGRHDCLFTPGMVVFRQDTPECEMLPEDAWDSVDVVSCAAPDLRISYYDDNPYSPTDDELAALLARRIDRILTVAALHGAEVRILGAFGCGAFRNPPGLVARAFNRALPGFLHHFENIEFAVCVPEGEAENDRAFRGIDGIAGNPESRVMVP